MNTGRIIAASFVRSSHDIRSLKAFLETHDAKMKVFSEIENADTVQNFNDTLKHSDEIMMARADLGVVLPLEDVTGIDIKLKL